MWRIEKPVPAVKFRLTINKPCSLYGAAAAAFLLPTLMILSGYFHLTAGAKEGEIEPHVQAGYSTQVDSMGRYYLTRNLFMGGDPSLLEKSGSGACAAGYHMASLWEILDPSALRYNPNLGFGNDDCGYGPPSYTPGWVRTGYSITDTSTIPGEANCGVWEKLEGYGTVINLAEHWDDTSQQDIGFWDSAFRSCGNPARVWCVSDEVDGAGTCSIPEPIMCNQIVSGNSTGYANHIQNYDCAPDRTESGPEVVYALELHQGRTFSVTASIVDLNGDLDIFFLPEGGCVNGLCLSQGSYGEETLTMEEMEPGLYYLVVDGFEGASGSYQLTVSCDTTEIYLPLVAQH